ncbi:MAG: calcium-binding protein [Saprospiraceae bacterium]
MNIEEIKIGDYVKVKEGIKAPDFEYQLMVNWQGKVVDIQKSEKLVEIEWDSETLLNTPEKYLKDLIKEGYDYEIMTLKISDLERANRRDNPNQRKDAKSELDAKLYWIELFEEEEKSIKYGKLFQGIKLNNYNELYQKWEEYLNENLKFPIETKVVESERGRIRNGVKIKLLDIEDYDDMYGIFGIGKQGREAVTFPICNLEAIDKKSKNYELLRDYAIWFANM